MHQANDALSSAAMRSPLQHVALAVSLWLLAAEAAAQATPPPSEPPRAGMVEHPWWIGAEFHLSALSNLVDKSTLNLAFGYSLKSGYRWRTDWGAYLQAEHNLWTETELEADVRQGVLNIGIGAERLFFRRRMRAALTLGPSILLYETALDDPGTTGLFVDVRPTGIRWELGKSLTLMLDPLTFTVVAPALGGIPLVNIQYRTALALEYGLVR